MKFTFFFVTPIVWRRKLDSGVDRNVEAIPQGLYILYIIA